MVTTPACSESPTAHPTRPQRASAGLVLCTGFILSGLGLFGVFACNASAQEEIHLDSGKIFTGELVSETQDSIVLRNYYVLKHKAIANVETFPKDQIVLRHQVPSFEAQYQARLKDTSDTMLAHLSLARWALDHALLKEASTQAKRADELDSDNVLVAKVLSDCGFTKDHDEWVDEDAYLKQTGKVIYNGKVMLAADADHLKAIAVATNDHDDALQAIKDDYGYLAHGDDKIKDATDKLATAKETQTRTKSEMDKDKSNIDAINKRVEQQQEQQQQQQQQQQQNGNGTYNRPNNNNNANNSDAQLSAAADAYSKAEQDHRAADRVVADLTRKLTKLKTAVGKAKGDLPVQIAKYQKAVADLTTLTGKAPVDELPADLDKFAGGAADSKGDGKTTSDAPAKPKSRFGDGTGAPAGGGVDAETK